MSCFIFLRCENGLKFFFFSSRRRHTRFDCDWSSDVCSSDLLSELPLWRIASWCGCGLPSSLHIPGRTYSAHLPHFLQLLPLLGRKNHHVFRHKRIILYSSAHHHVVAGLDVRHRDAFAPSAE